VRETARTPREREISERHRDCVQERDQNGKKESMPLSLFRQRETDNPISREGKQREREREREREVLLTIKKGVKVGRRVG